MIGKSLGYPNAFNVELNGKVGGLILSWKDPIAIKVLFRNSFMIHCLVENDGSSNGNTYQMTLIYRSPLLSRRREF